MVSFERIIGNVKTDNRSASDVRVTVARPEKVYWFARKTEQTRHVYRYGIARGKWTKPVGIEESTVRQEFFELSEKWASEIGPLSSLTQIVNNRHYLAVIGLGKAVIPFILEDLKRASRPWFHALQALTKNYEIGKQYAGKFRKMANAWIEWGVKNGYVQEASSS